MIRSSTPFRALKTLFYGDTMEFRATPRRTAIDATLLLSLIPEWEHEAGRRISAESARSYVQSIRPFIEWWTRYGPELDWQLSQEAINDFYWWLRNEFVNKRGKKPTQSGMANCLTRLRMLLHWAFVSGRADMDISTWVPTIGHKPKRSRLLSVEALRLLMVAAEAGKNPIRDKAIIGIMAGTGARSIEAFHARFEPGYLELHADKSGSIYFERTKGDKPRLSVFGPNTGKLIEAWMDYCGRDTGPFWQGELKAPKMLYEVVHRCAGRAGLGDVGPHDIRKLFCSYWYRQFDPSDSRAQYFLALQVGHGAKNITEKHYLNCTAEDLLPYYVSPLESPVFGDFF